MFCAHCGQQESDDSTKCTHCGAPIIKSEKPQLPVEIKPIDNEEKKFCTNCGKQIYAEAVVCVHCGANVNSKPDTFNFVTNDNSGGWGFFIGLLFPLIGLILSVSWRTTKPKSSKLAALGAMMGFFIVILIQCSLI